MDEKREWIAEGYCFYNQQDAELAVQERKKISYLESRMDEVQEQDILSIYNKAIEDRIFKTPVGLQYLKEMQSCLLDKEGIEAEEVLPIPIYVDFTPTLREAVSPARTRVKSSENKEKKVLWLPISIFLNCALAIAVAIMFSLAMKSEVPNVINYENALQNKYAAWEQELTEREQIIREKEKELRISEE